MNLCFISTFLSFLILIHGHAWFYNQYICTGLGDRIGTILTLSTLAHIQNTTVFFEWCLDASKAGVQNPLHYKFIPGWVGWQYSLHTFQQKFKFPPNVVLLHKISRDIQALPKVQTQYEIPAIQGMQFLYTMAYKTMYIGHPVTNSSNFKQIYKTIGNGIIPSRHGPDLVIHVRGPDKNTHEMDQQLNHFCTRKAIKQAIKLNLNLTLITNNISHATKILKGFFYHTSNNQPFDDMELLFSTRGGIIQHAGEGWSSFSSVPAMAKSIPLLTTYFNGPHRYEYFERYGALPSELHTCNIMQKFFKKVVQRIN